MTNCKKVNTGNRNLWMNSQGETSGGSLTFRLGSPIKKSNAFQVCELTLPPRDFQAEKQREEGQWEDVIQVQLQRWRACLCFVHPPCLHLEVSSVVSRFPGGIGSRTHADTKIRGRGTHWDGGLEGVLYIDWGRNCSPNCQVQRVIFVISL